MSIIFFTKKKKRNWNSCVDFISIQLYFSGFSVVSSWRVRIIWRVVLAGLLFFKACFISVLWFVTLVGLDTSSRFFLWGRGGERWWSGVFFLSSLLLNTQSLGPLSVEETQLLWKVASVVLVSPPWPGAAQAGVCWLSSLPSLLLSLPLLSLYLGLLWNLDSELRCLR